MERIQRNCRELAKVYQTEDVNSAKAAAFRKKLLSLLKAAESKGHDSPKAVELVWRTAYYEPVAKMRGRQDRDFLHSMVNVFIGEITTHILTPSRHIAQYYIILGDLMRYIESPLARLQYRRAVEANPDIGKPYNQLALQETGIRALRFFLLGLAAPEQFKNAPENLKKALNELDGGEAVEHVRRIVRFMVYEMRRQELVAEFIKLTDWIEVSGAGGDADLPLLLHTLVAAHHILPDHLGDDYFLAPIPLLSEIFSLLIRRGKFATTSSEGIAAGKRRRRRSDSRSGEESGQEETEEEEEEPERRQSPLWPISLCCQWLSETTARLATFDRAVTPISASVQEIVHTLTDRLIERLNELLQAVPMKNDEENAAEETNWLLNGPIPNGDGCSAEQNASAQKQLSYWTDMLTSSPDSDVEFVAYFRRRKAADPAARKKFGLLHLPSKVATTSTPKAENDDWLPIFVILDYTVMERNLRAVRTITAGSSVIPVVPTFVLAELDRMKSTGPSIRDAMRFIERKQSAGELRILTAKSHLECAEELIKTASEHRSKIGGPLVAVLVAAEKEAKTRETTSSVPNLVTYNIAAFMERWKRTVS